MVYTHTPTSSSSSLKGKQLARNEDGGGEDEEEKEEEREGEKRKELVDRQPAGRALPCSGRAKCNILEFEKRLSVDCAQCLGRWFKLFFAAQLLEG